VAALQAEKVRATTVTPDGFDVGYITEDGVEFRTPLTEAWLLVDS
jgi:hypothetical protein